MKRNFDPRNLVLAAALLLVTAFVISFARGLHWSVRTADVSPTGNTAVTAAPDEERRGRVDVRNATTTSGLAADVTDRLRAAGFDVVHYGNADTVPDSSAVIDRIGNPAIARAVADALGINRIRTAVDSTLYLDATVILGIDFQLPGR
ncbi:MAG TPA: LytR C-terminal domain-containing protein [Longimicrobiales bacterium]|nr:LytR C-terminal domain-containing protein [Longimicrobiales bacterium]